TLAIDDYDKAIQLEPLSAEAHFNRGMVYNDVGEFDLALEDLTKTIGLAPDSAVAYYLRGVVYDHQGRYNVALKDFSKAIEIDPSFAIENNYDSLNYNYKDSLNLTTIETTEEQGWWPIIALIVFWIYWSFSLQTIAKKTNTKYGWIAWIPPLSIYLMCEIARKPWWWIFLLLIPLVFIVFWIIIWMEIAKARGKPYWIGILIIVPYLNLLIPGYLAFSK
ncbi:unnamed protein product, partial [marine sediment metagenome]